MTLAIEKPFKGATDVWLTPKEIIDALGPFDLDPCAAPDPRPWPTATRHYTEADNGLLLPWDGFVWLNPPYSELADWLHRMTLNAGGGIALIFARTETTAFFRSVWGIAHAVFFLRGRIRFCDRSGVPALNAAAPSILVAYGKKAVERIKKGGLKGFLVECEMRSR